VHNIATASICIGLAVMLVSVMILGGFTSTIENKIYSFSGHLQVVKFTLNNAIEESPFVPKSELLTAPHKFEEIRHIQEYGHKATLLKSEQEIQGVLLKGVGPSFDTASFQQNIVEGRFLIFPDSGYSREILISKKVGRVMRVRVGDQVLLNFMDFTTKPPSLRTRQLTVTGLYETGLEDFDDHVIIGDIALIRRLNNWNDSLVGGYEIFVKDVDQIAKVERLLYDNLEYDLYPQKVSDKYIQFFDWMKLISKNEVIFLVIITFVACFNMASVLLIMIMERTQMIGLLKAMGASNKLVRKIFVYRGMLLMGKGMLLGNLLGIGLAFLQDKLKIVPLDPQNYYMEYVPIQWDWTMVIILNLLTFLIISLVLFFPTRIITSISPIQSIRFD
jgi:lipoprotein-releasing system permease protein